MKKENLIAQLEGAKALSSQVDIDKVIELLNQLEPEIVVETKLGMSVHLAEEIANKIERCLDYNSEEFVDTDSAEFELDWNNVIKLTQVAVYIDDIMAHVTETLESFIPEEDVEETEEIEEDAEDAEDDSLTEINQGLGLEPGGNPYAE